MEYGNGIVGDMCVHMLDMVRWMLDLGWPKSVSSKGGILVQKQGRANISDTQSALFDFGDLTATWEHRSYGAAADPEYPWGATIYGEKGTLKLSVNKYEFFPMGRNKATLSGTPLLNLKSIPKTKPERIWSNMSPPRFACTIATSSGRSPSGPNRYRILNRGTFQPPVAFLRTWQ